MPTSWEPSAWGRRFTGAGCWQLVLDEDGLTVKQDGRSLYAGIETLTASDGRIRPGPNAPSY